MSVARLTEEYENVLKAELVAAIEKVPDLVQKLTKDAVAKVVEKRLGLEYRYGYWDLSGNHRDGEFVRLVTNTANQYVQDNAASLTKTFLAKMTKEDTEEVKDTYRAKLADAIDKLLEDRAEVESNAIVAKVLGKKEEEA